ncbi:MAG: pteridine reductase [Gammaproteobacteria bacterium]|nr:pteridine reductase [Gammaproteobacteria bacterium]
MQPKIAFITGAARRIGAEIAYFLHEKGLNIILHYNTSQKEVLKLCNTLNSLRENSAAIVSSDLSKTSAITTLIKKVVNQWGKLDVLINNAAYFKPTPIGETSEHGWDKLLNINLKAPFFLSQAAAPYLKKQKGSIINIADIHGKRPMRYHSAYSISKAGLLMLTKTFARELAPHVRVNAISPGPTMWPEGKNKLTATQKKEIIRRTVLNEHGDPNLIAKTAFFLINDAHHITGQNFILDGGRSLLI